MKPGRAPHYRITKPFEVKLEYGQKTDTVTFPAGTFVRPVELKYLPEHIRNRQIPWPIVNKDPVWCYTRYGFHPIPRELIEEC